MNKLARKEGLSNLGINNHRKVYLTKNTEKSTANVYFTKKNIVAKGN